MLNPALSLPPREFELSPPEVARIKAAIETWDSYGVAADQRWLEPLVNLMSVGVEVALGEVHARLCQPQGSGGIAQGVKGNVLSRRYPSGDRRSPATVPMASRHDLSARTRSPVSL